MKATFEYTMDDIHYSLELAFMHLSFTATLLEHRMAKIRNSEIYIYIRNTLYNHNPTTCKINIIISLNNYEIMYEL